jgi:hypothetical protein
MKRSRPAALAIIALLVLSGTAGAQDRKPSRPAREKDLLPDPTPLKEQSPAKRRDSDTRPVDLRPKFERGQELRYTLETSSSTKQTPLGRAPAKSPAKTPPDTDAPGEPAGDSSSRVRLGLRVKVVEAGVEAGATVALVIDTLKASITSGETKLEFDSTRPRKEDDPAAALFHSLAGTTLTLKVDPAGNITSVSGGESLAALGQLTGSGGQKPGELFSSLFSSGKSSGTAKVGESWENSDRIESPLLGRFRMVTRHTLTALRGRDAHVEVRGRIEPDTEAPGGEPVTLQNVRHDGSYIWDTAAGALRQMKSAMWSEIKVRVGDRDVLTRSESSTTVTRQN